MKIQNPHDKFFKEVFSNTEVAKDFINNYLPQSITNIIDVDTLELQKDSFINEELQEAFSDMLFRVNINKREGYIYFLFEHKSYTSKNISFQLLKYMIEIWEAKVKKEKTGELPIIIPLLIYHGNDEWKIKTTLGEMIAGYDMLPEDVKKYVPDYEYLLYDLSRYTDEQIKGEVQLRILFTIFRNIFTKDNNAIRYIMNAGQRLTKEDVYEIIRKVEKTYPEGSEVVMTLAEKFREEGKLQGIQEGKTKALAKTAIRLLTKRFGILREDTRAKIERLDAVTLEIIIDEILEYKSIEGVNRYLKE